MGGFDPRLADQASVRLQNRSAELGEPSLWIIRAVLGLRPDVGYYPPR